MLPEEIGHFLSFCFRALSDQPQIRIRIILAHYEANPQQ